MCLFYENMNGVIFYLLHSKVAKEVEGEQMFLLLLFCFDDATLANSRRNFTIFFRARVTQLRDF